MLEKNKEIHFGIYLFQTTAEILELTMLFLVKYVLGLLVGNAIRAYRSSK